MKLLHVVDRFGWSIGGGDLYVERILEPLERIGIQSSVAYFNCNPGRSWSHLKTYHIPELMHFSGSARNGVARLREVIRELQPEAAFVHFLPNENIGLALVRTLPTVYYALDYQAICPAGTQWLRVPNQPCGRTVGLACLISAYTAGCYTRRPRPLFAAYHHTRATHHWLRHACILVPSRFSQKRFLAAGFAAEQLFILPLPIYTTSRVPTALHSVRPPIILFAGRLVREKGLDDLLHALASLTHLAWRLVIAGDGPERETYQALALQLGLSERVEFLGWLNDSGLDYLYTQAAFMVVPSRWPEPFGMVGPEAMVRGLPVIAYATGGIQDWLIDGETGLAVSPGDLSSLSQAIRRLLEDPDLRRQMGLRARSWVLEHLSFEQHCSNLQEIFERTISQWAVRSYGRY
jgi:glycosyltransferase involved in cell wall biosynthesis